MLAFCMQSGAGLYVNTGGEANLNGCQVYENQATVRAPVPGLTSSAPLERFVCLPSVQNGAGLYVDGVANLNGCQVYENVAQNVRDRPRPLPRTFLQRPAGTLRACARLSLQYYGGGLYVYSGGTANLDGCNVYSNEAQVSARLTPLPGPFLQRPAEAALFLACAQAAGGVAARILNLLDLSSSAPLERFVCSPSWHRMELGSTSMARRRSLTPTCTPIGHRCICI